MLQFLFLNYLVVCSKNAAFHFVQIFLYSQTKLHPQSSHRIRQKVVIQTEQTGVKKAAKEKYRTRMQNCWDLLEQRKPKSKVELHGGNRRGSRADCSRRM